MKKYVVLSADNIGNDIGIKVFDTRKQAAKHLSEIYKEILADLDYDVEEKSKTIAGFYIMNYDGDYYYAQIKTIEV